MSLRQQTALLAGLLCVLTAAAVALTAAMLARREAVREAEASLQSLARTMADRLDQHMFERYREMTNIAELAPLRTIWRGDAAEVRSVLAQVQESLPEYAWIGFATPDGTVRAATRGMLEGVSVAQRPWFIHGLRGTTVEDVHDAKLLDKLLRTSPDEAPFRFVDIAVPVFDAAGVPAGVVGAHLSWRWADEVRETVLADHRAGLRPELLVLSRDGEALIGPASTGLQMQLAAMQAAGPETAGPAPAQHADGVTFVDGSGREAMLTAVVPTRGLGSYPGLGWQVIARSPVDTALAPANRLFFAILLAGAFAAVAAALLANILADRAMRPLERLSRNIDLIGRGGEASGVAWQRGSRDVLHISSAIRSLLRRIGHAEDAERQARAAAADAEERVAEATRRAAEHRARLEDVSELRRLADTDPLSGLLNRRGFVPLGAAAMERYAATGEGAGVLMIDIDHFKRVNDGHGHAAGDRVIRAVAALIPSEVREEDHVARFGGEEFIVLLGGADEGTALVTAERVRQRIAATPIRVEGALLEITASIGVAAIAPGDRDFEDVVQRADGALYAAKSRGRNAAVLYGAARAGSAVA
nr:sensor domain-containing diguanylate cyclase [Ancylobacter lacus]